MRNAMKRAMTSLVFGLALTVTTGTATADEWPMTQGDYWEVTGIDIKDGGSWKYANWLATEWRKNLEYSKSRGWIKDYIILANVYGRSNEADLYLIRIREDIPSGPVGDQRGKEYREWREKTIEKMVGESGNRAEYREVLSSSLLQELKFRD